MRQSRPSASACIALFARSRRRRARASRGDMLRTCRGGDSGGLPAGAAFNDPQSWPRARRLDGLALDLVGQGYCALPAPRRRAPTCSIGSRHTGTVALAAYTQARPLLERALAIRERVLGPTIPRRQQASTTSRLPARQAILQVPGHSSERALAIHERVLGPDHPDTASSLNNLGPPASGPRRLHRGSAAL